MSDDYINTELECIERRVRSTQSLSETLKCFYMQGLADAINTCSLELEFTSDLKRIIESSEKLQNKVIAHITEWKSAQERIRYGLKIHQNTSLDTIQSWCEKLASIECKVQSQINHTIVVMQKYLIVTMKIESFTFLANSLKAINSLLQKFITATFVIDMQPPKLIQTGLDFHTSVRYLIGGCKFAGNDVTVNITIESGEEAEHILKHNVKSKNTSTPKLLSVEKANFTLDTETNHFTASFKNLKILNRSETETRDQGPDDKLYFCFETKISIGLGVEFTVWVISAPCVIITDPNQYIKARAILLWDSMFLGTDRRYKTTPSLVEWHKLADALSAKFEKKCGRGLNSDHKSYLQDKIECVQSPDGPIVTFSQFCEEPLVCRQFTFWEWFFATMKFCQSYVRDIWTEDGSIIGFISRKMSEEILFGKPPGTFLLRFSETTLGAIAISVVSSDKGINIDHAGPFGAEELKSKGVADCVRDMKELSVLYPDQSKSVFEKYGKEGAKKVNKTGYVMPTPVLVIEKEPTVFEKSTFYN